MYCEIYKLSRLVELLLGCLYVLYFKLMYHPVFTKKSWFWTNFNTKKTRKELVSAKIHIGEYLLLRPKNNILANRNSCCTQLTTELKHGVSLPTCLYCNYMDDKHLKLVSTGNRILASV